MRSIICVFVMLVMAGHSLAQFGGLTEANTNDENIQRIAGEAVSQMGSQYSLITVTRAQTQVVAGTMYHLDLDVNNSTGPNPEDVVNLSCAVKMHEVVWLDTLDLETFTCNERI
ncbi:uncharacterized protein LOC128216914 [Mya arenaria]|nr:uncharacterized protein LOC128216914 [Mya arenaria]XP_052779586.1 uncharacterized protein LOC128216914 [Mya arenaria]